MKYRLKTYDIGIYTKKWYIGFYIKKENKDNTMDVPFYIQIGFHQIGLDTLRPAFIFLFGVRQRGLQEGEDVKGIKIHIPYGKNKITGA